MLNIRQISLLVLAAVGMATQQVQQTTGSASVFRDAAAGQKLMQGSLEFTLALHKKLSKPGTNVFFSPTSISFAMAMTHLGSRGNTAAQMRSALGFSGVEEQQLHGLLSELRAGLMDTGGNYTLHLANRLYGQQQYPFLEDYIQETRKHYDAELQSVNFGDDQTRLTINKWVESQTKDKIKDLLADPLDPLTRLILVNAIYFKGDWEDKFDAKATKPAKFTKSNGDQVEVDMMFKKHKFNHDHIRDLKCQVLELPYKGHDLSMVILLPEAHDGLADLEAGLTVEHLNKIRYGQRGMFDVMAFLPRFRLEQSASLADTLSQLGMSDAFDASQADFSGMDGSRQLYVSDVVHKAFIEVNEEGSEAAAATAGIMMMRSMPRIIDFRADHPFLFFIRDGRSGSILFMGKMEEPPAAGARDEL